MKKNINGNPDKKALKDVILEMVLPNIKHLNDRQEIFLAKDLIGLDTWPGLDNGMRRQIGAMVYELVCCGLIPLKYAGKTSCNKHTYQIA